jgi:hypothetical protein
LPKRRSRRFVNIETASFDGIGDVLLPGGISLRLVMKVPPTLRDACGKRQRRAGVIGPLAGIKPVWPAGAVPGNRFERTWRAEFDRRAEGIPEGQFDRATASSIIA